MCLTRYQTSTSCRGHNSRTWNCWWASGTTRDMAVVGDEWKPNWSRTTESATCCLHPSKCAAIQPIATSSVFPQPTLRRGYTIAMKRQHGLGECTHRVCLRTPTRMLPNGEDTCPRTTRLLTCPCHKRKDKRPFSKTPTATHDRDSTVVTNPWLLSGLRSAHCCTFNQ